MYVSAFSRQKDLIQLRLKSHGMDIQIIRAGPIQIFAYREVLLVGASGMFEANVNNVHKIFEIIIFLIIFRFQ